MDPKKMEIKNLGNNQADENENNTNKDMTKELENLNKIKSKEVQPLITIKEHDIQLLKNGFDISYGEAKSKLIKSLGDVNKAMEAYLNELNVQ